MSGPVEGRCACGAVTVRAARVLPEMSACWCEPCRRWQGLVGMGLTAPAEGFSWDGPVRLWRSSEIADRAFCGVCGSCLGFVPLDQPEMREPCTGSFDDAAGAVLHHENWPERRPTAIRFEPEPEQRSGEDYAARAPVVGGTPREGSRMTGGCACGAVRFRLRAAGDSCGICHCDTCRRWTGGVFCSVEARLENLEVAGNPVLLRWRSTPGVERVSCAACGGKLWLEVLTRDPTGGVAGDLEVCLGALDDMGGRALRDEWFIDRKPGGYAFAGDHPQRTAAECLS